MNLKIRKAHLSDLPYIYEICLKTGLSGEDATDFLNDKYIIGQYFAAPYIHFEIGACFVLENNSIPVGYILGVTKTKDFNSWMNSNWLPAIKALYPKAMKPKNDFEKFIINLIHKHCNTPEFLNVYPSHFHIDILPIAQKKGYGKKLITTFINELKTKNTSGIHLSVGLKNKNAIEFYKNIGFKELKTESGALFMGLSL